ncbi:hypothetical protein PSPTOT1_2834 [Pseudomonas syringae pv. tomato T1]|nr:hypothetical protein PSPTOT1_2834 [Pseudomonas syringae pv. tomato T1]
MQRCVVQLRFGGGYIKFQLEVLDDLEVVELQRVQRRINPRYDCLLDDRRGLQNAIVRGRDLKR